MNDEIKEILEELKEYASGGMSGLYPAEYQVKQLLDYITNLQQEKEDYKSRCEKASEIIKKEKEIMGYAKYDSCLLLIENILQNGSDSQ